MLVNNMKKSTFLKLSQLFTEKSIHSNSRAAAGASAKHHAQAGFLMPLSNSSPFILCLYLQILDKLLHGQQAC